MKKAGWEKRHKEVIERHAALPAQYGVSDCYIFPDDNVEAVTGKTMFGLGVRKYKTDIGAGRHLRKKGFSNVAEAFASKFETLENTSLAQRGDIGTFINEKGEVCGGVFTSLGFAVKTESGLIKFHPYHEADKAFRVE